MAHTEVKCCMDVWDVWHTRQCTRNAVIVRNGLHYCKQHDPDAVETRNKERNAKYEAEREAQTERYRRQRACLTAFQGIPTEAIEKVSVQCIVEAAKSFYAQQCGEYTKKSCGHDFFCTCPGDALRTALAAFEEEEESR